MSGKALSTLQKMISTVIHCYTMYITVYVNSVSWKIEDARTHLRKANKPTLPCYFFQFRFWLAEIHSLPFKQHFLCFLPEPQGQGSLRPIFSALVL